MINSIDIKNFKSIKSKHFAMRGLNILLGLNGMGKSSFIQTLLLIRQSYIWEGLTLNGHILRIGNSRDALYQYAKDEKISIGLSFSNGHQHSFSFSYKPESDFLQIFEPVEAKEEFFNQSLWGSKSFKYLSAYRQEPKSIHEKSYTNVITRRNVGGFGEYAAHFLDAYGSEEVEFENLIHPKSISYDKTGLTELVNRTLLNQVNLWLGEISPGVRVRLTSIQNSENIQLEFEYSQPNFGTTNRFKPTNVGFGISYVLPVVIALLSSRPGDLLIIENPESHIHPRGQAELGKLMALVAMNDVQIVVETHSDHFVNGARVAVKNNLIHHSKIILFYFDKIFTENEQYSKITDVEIDHLGELSQYPKNMLDEWSNQLFNLI